MSIPSRVTKTELSLLYKVSQSRISTLCKQGKLIVGDDGKIDSAQALQFRAVQTSEQETNALFQHYGNRHGSYVPKIVEHTAAELEDWEVLGIDPPPNVVPAQQKVLTLAMERQATLSQAKLEETRQRIEIAKRRALRESGVLIERTTAYRAMQEAAAEIQASLRTLEHNIPAIFTDLATRSDVRTQVQLLVDQCLFTMSKKMKAFSSDSATTAEADD